MTVETEIKEKPHSLSVQERFDIEDKCIEMGLQFGRVWAINCGLVNTYLSSSAGDEPLNVATRMFLYTAPALAVGIFAGGGAGVLASMIYLARRG